MLIKRKYNFVLSFYFNIFDYRYLSADEKLVDKNILKQI